MLSVCLPKRAGTRSVSPFSGTLLEVRDRDRGVLSGREPDGEHHPPKDGGQTLLDSSAVSPCVDMTAAHKPDVLSKSRSIPVPVV